MVKLALALHCRCITGVIPAPAAQLRNSRSLTKLSAAEPGPTLGHNSVRTARVMFWTGLPIIPLLVIFGGTIMDRAVPGF
jgi:hypothetical protein